MIYKAENIDTEKALQHLKDLIFNSFQNESFEKSRTEKYYEGYRKGLEEAESMFHCSNYEKSKNKE